MFFDDCVLGPCGGAVYVRHAEDLVAWLEFAVGREDFGHDSGEVVAKDSVFVRVGFGPG